MNLTDSLPLIASVLSGFIAGVFLMYVKSVKDKKRIQQINIQLAVAEEKLTLLQQKEKDGMQWQQRYIEVKSLNAELRARMEEQLKNSADKLKLLQDAEARLNTQFENLAGKIFDERSRQ
ncbi:MAG: DNA recombination protein RmuC, partial [Gammaproteobacteria bacterium]